MLNNLPLIILMILSLFLAFYCVDSHKSKILSIVNTNNKSIEPMSLKVEEGLTKQEIKSVEKVYVEVLAVEDTNKTSKIVEKIKSNPTAIVDETIPFDVEEPQVSEKLEEIKEVAKAEPIRELEVVEETESQKVAVEEVKVEIDKIVNDEIVSEYSEGYKLDDLEKMILEELKKGNKE